MIVYVGPFGNSAFVFHVFLFFFYVLFCVLLTVCVVVFFFSDILLIYTAVYVGLSGVTESTATIRSTFCECNIA